MKYSVKNSTSTLAHSALWLCTFIWGAAFIFQKIATTAPPLLFNTLRSVLGGLALLIILLLHRHSGNDPTPQLFSKPELKIGSLLGLILAASLALQQIGLVDSTVSKASLITGLYVIFVPFIMRFMSSTPLLPWQLSVMGLGFMGMFLLTTTANSLDIGKGDLWLFASVPCWALHICYLARFAHQGRLIQIALIQILVCAAFSGLLSILSGEVWAWHDIQAVMPSLLYTGLLSSGVAYTLQVYGQERVNPSIAVLILSCEAFLGAWLGWYVLHEAFSLRNLFGAILIILAIVLVELTNYMQMLAQRVGR